ncbi:hypothetical protein Dimus_026714 [Dionaea muscipula]
MANRVRWSNTAQLGCGNHHHGSSRNEFEDARPHVAATSARQSPPWLISDSSFAVAIEGAIVSRCHLCPILLPHPPSSRRHTDAALYVTLRQASREKRDK